MADETTALVQEPAEPAIEEATNQTAIEPGDPAIEDAEIEAGAEGEGAEDAAEEDDELDFGFKKYRVPKSLKEGIEGLRRDYTQKTEALSHRTKEAEKQIARLQASEEEIGHRATLMQIDQQIAAYKDVNWQELEQDDPMAAQSHWRSYQMLKDRRQEAAGKLEQAQQQRLHSAQQETAKRLEATREAAQQIKGWTPEIDAKVTQFACQHFNATPEELSQVVTPDIYRLLHKAWIGEQSIQQQTAKPKPQPGNLQPLTTVNAKSNPSARKTLADMDMDEYVAARSRRA